MKLSVYDLCSTTSVNMFKGPNSWYNKQSTFKSSGESFMHVTWPELMTGLTEDQAQYDHHQAPINWVILIFNLGGP